MSFVFVLYLMLTNVYPGIHPAANLGVDLLHSTQPTHPVLALAKFSLRLCTQANPFLNSEPWSFSTP